MARRKQCRVPSEERGRDTLMPVSPKDQPMKEGLSRDVETASGEMMKDKGEEGSEANCQEFGGGK